MASETVYSTMWPNATGQVSKDMLRRHVANIAHYTGLDLTVGWAYGRPRVYANQQSVEVSPRLPKPQLQEWLWAFEKGWQAAKEGKI